MHESDCFPIDYFSWHIYSSKAPSLYLFLDNRRNGIYNKDVIFYIITTAKAENSIDDALDLSFRGANESYECDPT